MLKKSIRQLPLVILYLSIAYIPAVVAILPISSQAFRENILTLAMRSDATGSLQVFYDIGQGYQESDSVAVPLTRNRREYNFRIPPGTYRSFRIDPGSGAGRTDIGDLTIHRFGACDVTFRATGVKAIYQLATIEANDTHLVVEASPSSNDPQLELVPPEPIVLNPVVAPRFWLLVRVVGLSIAGAFIVALLHWVGRRVFPHMNEWHERATQWLSAHPKSAVWGAAAVATIVGTYPLVFLDRSLVSPNNGATALLYEAPPYEPGSTDMELEDVRSSDVGSTAWALRPYSHIERVALSQGEVPLWNRYNAAGRPLWGQGQSLVADPLHWPALLGPAGWDVKFIAHRFLFAAGVGMAALIALGAWLPASIAAAAVPFLGYYTYRLNHDASFTLTYGAWTVVAWFLLASARRRFEMARAAAFVAVGSCLILLASPPKEAVLMLAGCQMCGVLAVVFSGGLRHDTLRRFAFAAVGGVAFLMTTAPHWVVFLGTLHRSLTPYDAPRAVVGPMAGAPTLFLGSLSPVMIFPGMHIAAMLLIIAALCSPSRVKQQPALAACLLTAAGLLALALGAVPAEWLVKVPLVANIHQVNLTAITAAIVPLMIVCSLGAAALIATAPSMVLMTTSAVILLGYWFVGNPVAPPSLPDESAFVGLLIGGLVLVPVCVWAAVRAKSRVLGTLGVLSLGALVLLPGGLQIETDQPAIDRLLPQPRLRTSAGVTSPAVEAIKAAMTEPARTIGLGGYLLPGSQGLYGLEGIGGPDALQIEVYEDLVDAAKIERPWGQLRAGGWLTLVSPGELARVSPLLDMLNVGFVLAPTSLPLSGLPEVPIVGMDRLRPLRRPTAWPRAFYVQGIKTYQALPEVVDQMSAQRTPFAMVQATDRRAAAATWGLPRFDQTFVAGEAYHLTANTTSFTIRAPGRGVAVLTETFLPDDFRATLNGRRVGYFRVNHAFKGVAIPSAGEWRVSFEYRPHYWYLSLVVGLGGLFVLAGLVIVGRRPRAIS